MYLVCLARLLLLFYTRPEGRVWSSSRICKIAKGTAFTKSMYRTYCTMSSGAPLVLKLGAIQSLRPARERLHSRSAILSSANRGDKQRNRVYDIQRPSSAPGVIPDTARSRTPDTPDGRGRHCCGPAPGVLSGLPLRDTPHEGGSLHI